MKFLTSLHVAAYYAMPLLVPIPQHLEPSKVEALDQDIATAQDKYHLACLHKAVAESQMVQYRALESKLKKLRTELLRNAGLADFDPN